MLVLNNISKSFGKIKVLDKINLKIEQGDLISIIGKSGSGKSSLNNVLRGLGQGVTAKIRPLI